MKKLISLVLIASMMLLLAAATFAQEWTKEQSEVWKVVEDSWVKWKAGDIDGMTASFHDKYQGWSSDAPLPMGKADVVKWYNDMKGMMKINYYFIEPARIAMTKSGALVDYYFSFNATYTSGDKSEAVATKGKNVEFYVLEGGKWLLLGDMTLIEKGD